MSWGLVVVATRGKKEITVTGVKRRATFVWPCVIGAIPGALMLLLTLVQWLTGGR